MKGVLKPCFGSSQRNYLIWATEVRNYLAMNNLSDTIKHDSKCTNEEKKRARDYLWCHLGEDFQNMFIVEQDPVFIWDSLHVHFEKMKEAELLEARYNWEHLRFDDFDSVVEYNSAVQRVSAQLKLCGREVTEKDLMEKTLTTFPSSQRLLVDMYRKKNHKTYLELISELFVAEKHDEANSRNYNGKPAQAGGSKRKR